MLRVRVGDRVRVISGKDKGKEGKVLRVLLETDKVVVEGLNIVTKHEKPTQKNPQGGIKKKEAAMFACKVMPLDPETGKPTRVKFQVKDEKKVRVATPASGTPAGE